jgi:cation:H+ antiporter
MAIYFLFTIIGFAMLYFGAEWLVKGSSSFARSLGIKPIVIGLTVVAFGTSAPELVVSVISSIKGKSMIAVGNIVGSNICNIALILGASALFRPITCHYSVIRRDIPIMLAISLFLLVLSVDSNLGRLEGITMFTGIILYTIYNYRIAMKETRRGEVTVEAHIEKVEKMVLPRSRQIILIAAGIACVVAGAQIAVNSAVKIMIMLEVSEKFIGLTIVALGTSLPELATSVVAAVRRELDISIGNLVGSNVMNILSVLGIAALIRPIPIPGGFFESGLFIDYLVMIFTSFLSWVALKTANKITRKEGIMLISCYIGYLAYLIAKV